MVDADALVQDQRFDITKLLDASHRTCTGTSWYGNALRITSSLCGEPPIIGTKRLQCRHYSDVIMGAMAFQITSLTIVYSTVYSHADQRKHQISPQKWPVTRKMFPFDDVIITFGYQPIGAFEQPVELSDTWWRRQHFPRYWPFVRGIHRSPVNSPHKGQWRGALMLSLICAWKKAWVNNPEADVLRRHRAHYDVTVMKWDALTAIEVTLMRLYKTKAWISYSCATRKDIINVNLLNHHFVWHGYRINMPT